MDHTELLAIAAQERQLQPQIQIRCCTAVGCTAEHALTVKARLEERVTAAHLDSTVKVCNVGCLGLCSQAPLVQVDPLGLLYQRVRPDQAASIVDALEGGTATAAQADLTHPFFTRQLRIVLENVGRIDPERIEEYIAADGYQALYHVLRNLSPEEVVDQVTRSGLRGRGGAGYPTGLKWATVAKMPAGQKYVICNADEGDPGAFMDRSVLESDPHRVLEGMAIAAYAVGANQGFIYVRGEYPVVIQRLQTAIQQARRYALLGTQIFDSPFDFRVDLRIGAGAYVCGEETALIASIEGKRGVPRPRPPYPAESGLWGAPTLINNVETLANIPPILRHGGEWYARIGTETSKGTKVFSLTGKVSHAGLIEVPLGTPLRQIVEEMGGGVPNGGQVKAVQTGGPSGGCIPAAAFDTPVDYESLRALGSTMGSGGMIVLDQDTSMVELARFFMEFCMDESCGKCIPCRAGTVQLHGLLTSIQEGRASPADLEQLESLCDLVKHTSLCGLGQAAPNPVLSTLRHFREEYLARLTPHA